MPAKPALDATQLTEAAVVVARARREGRSSAAVVGELVSAFPISLSTAYRLRERPDFQALVTAASDTLPLEDVAEEDDRQPVDLSIEARDREAGGVPTTPAPAQPEQVFEPADEMHGLSTSAEIHGPGVAARRPAELRPQQPPPPALEPDPPHRPGSILSGLRAMPAFATQADRLAYYERHRLDSEQAMLDCNDARAGRETPNERRAREAAEKAGLPGRAYPPPPPG
jgi:hypothetical protein